MAVKEELVYRSKLPDIEISNLNHLPLHAYCFQRLPEFRDRPCIIDGSSVPAKVYPYWEVQLICRRVGSGLAKLGVGRGDVIMLLLPNCPEFVFAFMGASFRGAVATTANPFYTPREIGKQAEASGARLVVTLACHVHKLRALKEQVIVVTVDDPDGDPAPEGCVPLSFLTGADQDQDHGSCDAEYVGAEEVVALPFSSGTTGLPKGVMLTHNTLVSNIAQQVDGDNPHLYLCCEDVMLCVLPLFHIYSLDMLLCSLRTGAAILTLQKFETTLLLELIERFRVTVAPLVPPIVLAIAKNSALHKFDLSSVRCVMSGAAPLGKDLEDALKQKISNAILGQAYGMTETGPVITMSLAFAKKPFPVKSDSCGTLVRNSEMKIIDPHSGVSLPRNKEGEICVRGPQIMKGYLNDGEATEKSIDRQGWFHSGDIGYMDEEEEVFIVDRVKELIKYKGYQVAPAEVEAILVSHPFIADAAVAGKKDEVAGEVPVGFVVISEAEAEAEAEEGHEISAEEIKQFVAKEVAFYKKLHHVYFVDSIPKSQSGKILRSKLPQI